MYDYLNNVFVVGFIGLLVMNLFDLLVIEGGVKFGVGIYLVICEVLVGIGSFVIVGIRFEDFIFIFDGQGLLVVVDVVEELGVDAYIYGQVQVY